MQRSSRDPKARVRAVVHVIPFRAKYHYKVSHVFKSSNFRHRRVSLSLHRCNGNRSRSTSHSVLLSVTRSPRLSRPVPNASLYVSPHNLSLACVTALSPIFSPGRGGCDTGYLFERKTYCQLSRFSRKGVCNHRCRPRSSYQFPA